MSEASLELRGVSLHRGNAAAIADCNLRITEGSHTAILGRSGAGKSTALQLLAGLVLPTSGEVLVDGAVASSPGGLRLPPHRRHISMVFQDLGLWPSLSVMDNVALGSAVAAKDGAPSRERALEALRLCRIEDLRERRPGSLSGGELQRVALARAIAARPRFLFLDEPFAGLDLCTKRELVDDIAQLASARTMTIVLVTHDPAEAFSLCGRAVLLDQGHVETEGSWEQVLRAPHSDLLKAFQGVRALTACQRSAGR